MSFVVPADAYDRFMGRYSRQLSPQFADVAGVRRGQRVLDVGCGPGALTAELVARLGADHVCAVDRPGEWIQPNDRPTTARHGTLSPYARDGEERQVEQGTARGVQRRRPRDHHHDHGPGVAATGRGHA